MKKDSGLLFPKQEKKKKRKTQGTQSILQADDGVCFLCMCMENDTSLKQTQEHHVFGGPRRGISEREGLKIYLCVQHHIYGPYAIHTNKEVSCRVKAWAQRMWQQEHPDGDWMELMGKNYQKEQEDGNV